MNRESTAHKAEWGEDPDFFGPRHEHREGRIVSAIEAETGTPGLHLECACGIGSLSFKLRRNGHRVVAADYSMLSLAALIERRDRQGLDGVWPVVVDITGLPFDEGAFDSSSSCETLEHIPDHETAMSELGRVTDGPLIGTVPAGPEQWSEWDDWAGHERRYTKATMTEAMASAGLSGKIVRWGFPFLRFYDDVLMKRINRRRFHVQGAASNDPTLAQVAKLGKKGWLVRLVMTIFALDRPFDGNPWGVGLLFRVRKAKR